MSVEDPRVSRSRAAILDAAADVFLADGYAASTVDRVAERAGVVKRTVYNLYADKETLFRETILRSIEIADGFSASLASDVALVADPAGELPGIGIRLAESVLLGRVLPLRRRLIMESDHFPDLVAEYRSRAPEAVMRALAELFDRLMAAGSLRRADPVLTAEHFAFLVMGADLDRGLFSGETFARSRVRERATAGARAFLAAYAVRPRDPEPS